MITAKLIKIQDAPKCGEYQPTKIDEQKKAVRYLLQAIDGCFYTVWDNAEKKTLTVHGERSFKKLVKNSTYMCDF